MGSNHHHLAMLLGDLEANTEDFQSTERGMNPLSEPSNQIKGSKFCLKAFLYYDIQYSGIFDMACSYHQ